MQKSSLTLLQRANTLLKTGTVTTLAAAAAHSASANPLLITHSGQGLFDNSGFFASTLSPILNESSATIPGGFKLSGSGSLSDYDFYYTDEGELESKFDGDGLGFLWAGDVVGPLSAGDTFEIDIDLSYTFTHTPTGEYDEPYVSAYVAFGLFDNYGSTVNFSENYAPYGDFSTDFYSDTVYAPGTYDVNDTISLEFYEGDFDYSTPTNWFLTVYVSLEHENSHFSEGPLFPKRNGDTLSVTIPAGSIDVVHTSVIPEPSLSVLLLGLSSLGFVATRRKRTAA